jgi:hypothetical protein
MAKKIKEAAKHRTSIGHGTHSRPTSKNAKRNFKKYRGQGK